ncbi:multicopper oxidase [Hydnomerulius pinastri MD-312]|uniref:Multicopper oxidase n=1 Tax=Hydnomerulius pinastri MD-312 TaxID=994086 RepID=A0A0C9W5S7_9AGAM|nr:multicopper oxidase [Hydnomerulius pinastri MD-312]
MMLHFVFALALVCSSVTASIIAGPKYRQYQRLSSSTPNLNVLGPVSQLHVVNRVIAPDGFPRSTVLAGGVFPGPLIQAQKGDDFRINVVNQLHDTSMNTTTSVHWHGIYQRKSNWADGTAGVTQCPIKPDRNFLHQFNAQDQAGTYWYHSHLSAQYCDGLRGPLVIYDPEDPHAHLYDVDDASTVITLSDWYHTPSTQMYRGPFTPNSTLINGLGRYEDGPMSPLAVVDVEQGKRYRFRIVGASCDPWFNFTIDGHTMTVIETDGIETEPFVVDSLPVFAGQRYSVVVAANQTVGNYWIRALSNHPNQTFDGGQSSAILRYQGAPVQDPTTQPGPYVLPYNENEIRPLVSPGAPGTPEPGKADVNINLVPGLGNGQYTINGVPFIDPSVPVLLQILSGARHPSQLLPNGSVYELPLGKVIEISIPATELSPNGAVGGPHAVHLHGHTFDVVRGAGSSTFNFANPVRRDTVSLGLQANNDNVTIRFVTDNPGPWFFHCHNDFHLHNGFAVVMAEAPVEAALQEEPVIPGYWNKLCD